MLGSHTLKSWSATQPSVTQDGGGNHGMQMVHSGDEEEAGYELLEQPPAVPTAETLRTANGSGSAATAFAPREEHIDETPREGATSAAAAQARLFQTPTNAGGGNHASYHPQWYGRHGPTYTANGRHGSTHTTNPTGLFACNEGGNPRCAGQDGPEGVRSHFCCS